ncbi:sensor histidine kinase [Nonomuraea jabiensis]|uniref:sensor histidine kinase n=1 Tax=Nonomuraea jabiensis TaxID=882448 RepID=UPI003D7604BF
MVFVRHRFVRAFLWSVLVAYLAWGPIAIVVGSPSVARAALVAPIGVIAFGCCVWGVLCRAPRRNAWLLLVALAGGLAMHAIQPYTGLGFCFVVTYAAPYRTKLPAAMALTTLGIVAAPLVSRAIGLDWGTAFGMTAGLAYTAVIAFLISHASRTKRQAAELAEARAGEAVLSERARVAREVHDILAHSQSAQIVYLEGARLLLKNGGDPAAALDRVERAVHLARGGLEETRRALDALREEELPLPERLERLAAEFRAATGAGCALSIGADLGSPAAEARLAVARTAQEALTNVRKHAPGASVSMALRRTGRWCELEVRDDGGSADPAVGGLRSQGTAVPGRRGYGLIGMRERAELLGGSLRAGAEQAGFAVVLRVPA